MQEATTTQKEQLDQDVVNIAKAIRQVETQGTSSPYTAKGASGEFGAYQYTKPTWDADAKEFLGDKYVPLEQASKEIQNEVAYKKLKKLKDQGYNVGQVASIWNSGSPEWEGKKGKNQHGVEYDVPKYVDSVAAAYQALKGNNQAGQQNAAARGQEPVPADGQEKRAGAFFKSNPDDTAIEAGLKTFGNLIPSAFNFAKGAVELINPINIARNIAEIPGAFQGLKEDAGGTGAALGAFAKELPGTAYESLVPEAGRALIAGDTERAQAAITEDPFGQIAPFVFGAKYAGRGVDAVRNRSTAAATRDYVGNIAENTRNRVPIPKPPASVEAAVEGGISKTARVATAPVRYAFGKRQAAAEAAQKTRPTDAAGRILQATEKDAALGAKVLPKIETKGVKTYGELSNRIQKTIDTDLKKVDASFKAVDPKVGPVKLSNLKREVTGEFGGTTAKAQINYVREALTHLEELYRRTSDPARRARIIALQKQATTKGLLPSEINQIARDYGREFGSKAFSKRTGDPLTSVNAQRFENVRKGVKDTARDFLPDDTAKNLDLGVADAIRVKQLVDTMKEKVNKLEQRVTKRNIAEKVGRHLGTAIDVATFGSLRAFIGRLFPSNIGLKTVNSLDLERQLSRNLRIVDSLNKASDSVLAETLANMMRAANQLPEARVTAPTVFGRPQ